jgi:hypothetical protein
VFEYSIRDFFECQNVVEACWSSAFFTQFREVFECQKFWVLSFLEVSVLLVSSVRELVLEWVLVGWREVCEVAL